MDESWLAIFYQHTQKRFGLAGMTGDNMVWQNSLSVLDNPVSLSSEAYDSIHLCFGHELRKEEYITKIKNTVPRKILGSEECRPLSESEFIDFSETFEYRIKHG